MLFSEVQAETSVYGDSDVPIILPRSTWDNTPSLNALMTWTPSNTEMPSDWQPVERIVIHHSATPNNDTISPVSRIQSIYRFQAVTQGWGDIGYNYIIDQQGNIYEGRYGGNGSRGAHVYYDKKRDNFNFGTIGIAILGDYSQISPSSVVESSLVRLVAWLAVGNSLDPTQLSRSTSVWNTLMKIFNSTYNLPVVLGHKDIESTICPGKVDLIKVRQQAGSLAAKYKNYIYQAEGSPKVYKILLGTRQVYDNFQSFVASGATYDKLLTIYQSQLDIFSESRFLRYPDGSLLQISGQATVYLISDGQKRSLNVSAKEFAALGFDFAKVKIIAAEELSKYAEGSQIKYGPDKQVLSDGEKVFLVQGGKKRWIPSSALFSLLGYSWPKVKIAPEDLKTYLEGEVLTYPNGTLLRAVGGEAVYLVDKGQLKRFVSAEIFKNLKYSWSKVKNIPSQELAYYPVGDYVKYPENQLLRPEDEVNVYVISGGKPQVVDAATFKKKKYKWANVLVIAAQDWHVLYKGAVLSSPSPTSSGPTASPATTLTPSPSPAGSGPTASQPPASPTASPVSAATPKMRVAIYEVKTPSVILTASTAYNILDKAGQIIATKNANENYVYIINATTTAFIKIVPQSADGIVQIISYEDHPTWKPSLNYNQFHGTAEIIYSAKSNKIWAVNELSLEDYLNGIAEISATDAAEYQKAMIAAARTYAQYYIQKGGKRGADEVYILNNTTSDQLYKGYGREVLAPSIVQAVKDTFGEIITYNGNPIVSAYSSGAAELQINGTKSACFLWGSKYCEAEFAYLAGGVKDPAGASYDYAACGGANHCVGLSGAGARAFAKAGTKNYQEILKYYYTGTEIKKAY